MQKIEKNFKNLILFVDGGNFDSSQIKEKIKLLRTSDAIKSMSASSAIDFLEKSPVSTIILYSKRDNFQILTFLKRIEENKILSSIPKILIEEECSSNYLIEAYDLNIDDIIHKNMEDWELLARIIKILNKKAQNDIERIKDSILRKLEAFEEETKIFGEKYYEEIMESEISNSI